MSSQQASSWSSLWPVALLSAGCGVAAVIYLRGNNKKKKDTIPSVPGYPLIGNVLDMLPDNMLENFVKFRNKYGNLYRMHIFSQKFLHVSDSTLVREIMSKRPKLLKRSSVLEPMAESFDYLPYGLFHANDATIWGKMRKLSSPAFSKQNLVNMSKLFLTQAVSFVKHLEELSHSGNKIDMIKECSGYTTHVISSVAFGNDTVDYFFKDDFYEDTRLTLAVILDNALFPFPLWVWRLTPMYQRELAAKKADARFTAAAQRVIDIKRSQHANMSEDEKKHLHGLLDIMIRQDGARDAEIMANVKTFYLAGSDTTSMTISWTVYLLVQHPEAVARIRAEVAPFFAAKPEHMSAQEVADALASFTYTTAAIKEAIRLYPAGPSIFLDYVSKSDAPLTLSNGLTIDTDTTILLNLWICLTDEDNYTDAMKFQPERWFTEDQAQLVKMENAFLGFGSGQRVCPGKRVYPTLHVPHY